MTSLLHEILEESLTERETEILEGVAEGETAVQTGKRLYLSSETVKGYRKRVIAKLGARTRPMPSPSRSAAASCRHPAVEDACPDRGQNAIASIGALTPTLTLRYA